MEAAQEHDVNRRLIEGLKTPVPKERMAGYEAALKRVDELVLAKGVILGETVLDTMRFGISTMIGSGKIASATTILQCQGRDRQDGANPVREGALPPYSDGEPATIKMGMLRIGNVYVASVDGEVYGEIASRLKREAPVSQLMMTTLANGMTKSGYIYSNAASPHLTFQVISSRFKPGCAENKIVNSGASLISQLQN
jgi:hypothetical protein